MRIIQVPLAKSKKVLIQVGIFFLSWAFEIMKKKPLKREVLIMSRQSNEPSLDIRMLKSELDKRNIKTVILCKKMESGFKGRVKYLKELFKQMKYLATTKVVVIDGYNIPVSILKHREETIVIQMWHALGAMKKFGRSILDMPEGSSSEIADLMKMHEGYDYIFTSSKTSRPAFAEAFGYLEDKLSIVSLPRVDAILDNKRNEFMKKKIRERYSELTAKKTILYAPTLRVGEDATFRVDRIINTVDTQNYNLIIKLHPLTQFTREEYYPINVVVDGEFESIDMLSIADYVITDYSAFTYEAALKGLPIYFYAYDKEIYIEDRSFYLDYDKEMPGPIFSTITEVVKEIETGKRTIEYKNRSKQFAKKYIENQKNCTDEIVNLLEGLL